MAKQFPELSDRLRTFIGEQSMYFVGTAARDGRVNVSPKGLDSLRVLSPLAWSGSTAPAAATRPRHTCWTHPG